MFCDIAASFNRLRVLANKLKHFDRVPFWIKILLMVSYSFLFYSYLYTGNASCEKYESKANKTFFSYLNITFRETQHGIILETIHSFVRDILCLIILATINIITLVLMKRSLKKKRYIANESEKSKAEKVEKKLTYMVFVTSLIYILGHCSLFIYFIPIEQLRGKCLNNIIWILYYLSNLFNFFIYLSFNKHFKNYFKTTSIKIIKLISFNQLKLGKDS
jgi:Trk-type K+ transport system membrane component